MRAVTLLDIRMPQLNGSKILAQWPEARVIMLTTSDLDEDIEQAVGAGAYGYLLKKITRDQLVQAIRQVHAGRICFPEAVAQRLAANRLAPRLSEREREVLALLPKGLTNPDIARVLGISMSTTKTHLRSIFSKLDVMVRLRGCALPFFNRRGELLGVHVVLTDRSDLEMLRPPPADPFSVPEASLDNLRTFAAGGLNQQRQRVKGVVTLSRPGEFFYLQAGERAVRVATAQAEPLAVGDLVEAVGFAEVAQYYAELREAIFRKLATRPAPEPVPLNWEQATRLTPPGHEMETFDFDGRLVSLQGRLVRVENIPGESVRLLLDHEGRTVAATFGENVPDDIAKKFRPGSDLSVTGVCVIALATAWPTLDYPTPTSFGILLRSPEDIAVVKAASWWTARRLFGALTVTVAVLALALIWVSLLQRTVAKQAVRLMVEQQAKHDADVEFKATLRERNRLAADLHDTMEQDLTAVALQLEAAKVMREGQPQESIKRADFAYELLDRSRDDLRRSLWSLRVGVLEGRSFADALQELTTRTERTYEVNCTCRVNTDGTRVPEFEANHLLLLAQEAINNALKHGQPNTITVATEINSQNIILTVSDDGNGFDPERSPGPQQGHFGLLGIRERARTLNGTVTIHSAAGQGAQVEVKIPLNPPPAETHRS
jgi:signal transduction histidine kinase/FixJ family two-component response regulator